MLLPYSSERGQGGYLNIIRSVQQSPRLEQLEGASRFLRFLWVAPPSFPMLARDKIMCFRNRRSPGPSPGAPVGLSHPFDAILPCRW